MLDLLLAKCTSLAHFHSIVGIIDQVANLLKTGFSGPLEQEAIDIITQLLSQQATQSAQSPAAPQNSAQAVTGPAGDQNG